MNKLDAVRAIVSRCGKVPANSLDTGGGSDMGLAEAVLDEIELSVQSRGWHYNTRRDITLSPHPTSLNIEVPQGVITIDSYGPHRGRNVTQQGGILYDLDNNTATFTEDLRVEYIERLDWCKIPYPIRWYITLSAAAEFNTRYSGEHDKQRFERQRRIEDELREAKAGAMRFNGDAADVNVLRTRDGRDARGGRRRYRGRAL